MSLASRAVRGAGVVLLSSYTNMALGIVYGIVMARLLDPAAFGVVALATFFVTLLDVRGKVGLDYAFIHRAETTDELIATHWTLQMGASFLTLILVVIAAGVIAVFDAQLNYPQAVIPIMIALAGALIIEGAGTTARAALEKELVFLRSTVVITGSLLLSYLAAAALAAKGYSYWALVGQLAINAALSSVGFWWSFQRIQHRPSIRYSFNEDIAKWLLRYGAALVIGSIATVLLLQFDNFLVGTFVGAATLGFYAQAYKVAQWPTGLVTHVVSRTALPTYAKLQADTVRLAKAFEMTLWLILTLATPIALAIFVSAPDFLNLLWGEKWLPSAILLRFLIGYSVLRPLLDDTGALFTAIGKPKLVTLVLITQAITLMVVAMPLTIFYGAIGTAIGVGAAFLVGIVLAYHFVNRTLNIRLRSVFTPPIIATLASVALYFFFSRLVDLNSLPLFLRVMVKGGFTAGAFLLILAALEPHVLLGRVSIIWRLLRGGAA